MAQSNTASNVRVVIREGFNQGRIHEYTPITVRVINNGRKKPDELEATLAMQNRAGVNDTIHYIEDPVDLTYCDAIWNFQLSLRDERGYNFDPSKRAFTTIECSAVEVSDNCFVNGLEYTAVNGAKSSNVQFDMSGTDEETAADLADSINNDTRIPTLDFDIVAVLGVGANADTIYMYIVETGTGGNAVTITSNDNARLILLDFPVGVFQFGASLDIAEDRFKQAESGKFQGNYYLEFAFADNEVTIPIEGQAYQNNGIGSFGRWSLKGQFDIDIWVSPDLIPGIGNDTPVIWSQYNGTYGLDIGLAEDGTTGNWYINVRYNFGSGEVTIFGQSAKVFEEGVSDQTPRHIRVCRGGDNIIRLFAMGEEDEQSSIAVASSLEDPTTRNDIIFGSDNGGTLDFAGKLHQVKLYSGNILTEDQYFKSVGAKAQPISMKFGGQIWDKKDKSTTKKVMAQGYSKDLNNFMITLDAITKISIGSVARGAVGGEDAFYSGNLTPSLSATDNLPQDIALENHSSIQGLYILGTQNNGVTQYSLNGNTFDLKTAVPYSPTRFFSVNSQDAQPTGFSVGGAVANTHWFMCGTNTNKVYHYIMASAQDISTSDYQGSGDDYDFSAQTTAPLAMEIPQASGFNMYIVGSGKVFWYVLGGSLNPSTAVYQSGKDLDVSNEDNNMHGISFTSDGKHFYMVGGENNKIYHYEMTTMWDLGTAVLSDTLAINQQLDEPRGIWASGGTIGALIVMDAGEDEAYKFQQRAKNSLAAANRYGAGEMDDIIRDLINNLDDSFLVRTLAPMPSQWNGDFLADGLFSEVVNLLLVRGELTFYVNSRKVLIIEKQVEFSQTQKTNHQFYQIDPVVNTKTTGGQGLGGVDGVFHSYKISAVDKNDGKLINDITLLGGRDSTGTVQVSTNLTVKEGDTVHSVRINVPQIRDPFDLDAVADALVLLANVTEPQYKVESPSVFIPHIRFNHLIKIFNAMINLDGDVEGFMKVESVETNYPSGKVILTVNQFPITFFELSGLESSQVMGLQSDNAIPTTFTLQS